jgi:S-formylglutathione hydrolase FrmB
MKLRRTSVFTLSLLLIVSSLQIGYAQAIKAAVATGKLVELKVSSSALKGNLLGDPVEQTVDVYLPPSYETSPAKRYPTIYLLHGYSGGIKDWTDGYQGMGIRQMMDELIRSGTIREMIVVVPNGANAYLGSFYTNSVVTGNWEDYIYRDLVSFIDSHFRTIARPESRGIAGHSMGGYGSVVMGMKHPDVFSAVYALSPCCMGMEGDIGAENQAWNKIIALNSEDQLSRQVASFEEFWKIVGVALSASFSPDKDRLPFHVDFPFKQQDGKLVPNEPAYSLWRSKMPLYMVDSYKQNLLKLRGLYLDVGQNDEFSHIRITTPLFSKALSDKDIPHGFEIYAGGTHNSKIRERMENHVLEFFSHVLDFPDSKGTGTIGLGRNK